MTTIEQWAVGASYTADDVVAHQGGIWEAVGSSTGVHPGSDPSKWRVWTPNADVATDGAPSTFVYGTPGDGKVPVWNASLQRWEFGDGGGGSGASVPDSMIRLVATSGQTGLSGSHPIHWDLAASVGSDFTLNANGVDVNMPAGIIVALTAYVSVIAAELVYVALATGSVDDDFAGLDAQVACEADANVATLATVFKTGTGTNLELQGFASSYGIANDMFLLIRRIG